MGGQEDVIVCARRYLVVVVHTVCISHHGCHTQYILRVVPVVSLGGDLDMGGAGVGCGRLDCAIAARLLCIF